MGYARVDAVEVDGRLVLRKLEMLEPELFLRHAPGAPGCFGETLLALGAAR